MNSSFLRMVAVCAVVSVASACDDSINESIDNLRVNVSTSKAEFTSGETVVVGASITNNDGQSVMITVPSCGWRIEVKHRASGDPPFLVGCLGNDATILLAAGETRDFQMYWSGPIPDYQAVPSFGGFALRGIVQTNRGAITSEFTPIEILPR